MKTTLLIIRHGQTDLNLEHRMDGQGDTQLTEVGLRQAELLGDFLAKYKIDSVYSSPLSRAIKTAGTVIERQSGNLKVNTVDNFREIDCGECTGLTRGEVEAKFPELIKEWSKNTDPPFPGGESLRNVDTRALPVVFDILAKHPGRTVLISGHGSLNVAIIGHFLQIPPALRFKIRQDNCCVNILEFEGDKLNFVRGINLTA